MKGGDFGLFINGDFNLYNIIFNPVNDIFIDAHFIRKVMEFQIVFPGKCENLFIPPGKFIPIPFMEGP